MTSRFVAPLSIALLLLAVGACNDDGGKPATETPAEASGETPEPTEAGGAAPAESPA